LQEFNIITKEPTDKTEPRVRSILALLKKNIDKITISDAGSLVHDMEQFRRDLYNDGDLEILSHYLKISALLADRHFFRKTIMHCFEVAEIQPPSRADEQVERLKVLVEVLANSDKSSFRNDVKQHLTDLQKNNAMKIGGALFAMIVLLSVASLLISTLPVSMVFFVIPTLCKICTGLVAVAAGGLLGTFNYKINKNNQTAKELKTLMTGAGFFENKSSIKEELDMPVLQKG